MPILWCSTEQQRYKFDRRGAGGSVPLLRLLLPDYRETEMVSAPIPLMVDEIFYLLVCLLRERA